MRFGPCYVNGHQNSRGAPSRGAVLTGFTPMFLAWLQLACGCLTRKPHLSFPWNLLLAETNLDVRWTLSPLAAAFLGRNFKWCIHHQSEVEAGYNWKGWTGQTADELAAPQHMEIPCMRSACRYRAFRLRT